MKANSQVPAHEPGGPERESSRVAVPQGPSTWRQRWYASAVFWPTWWWNILWGRVFPRRAWWTEIDQHILLGARPFRKDLAELKRLGVGGVINTCAEFSGDVAEQRRLGLQQCYVPTVDFTVPTSEALAEALKFIDAQIAAGRRVYVHCKAGRGRSATVVMAYLLTRRRLGLDEAQALLLRLRPHVNAHLTQRRVLQELAKQSPIAISRN